MITKYELRECKHLKMEISELREQISELVSMMTAPRISRLTGMPGSAAAMTIICIRQLLA